MVIREKEAATSPQEGHGLPARVSRRVGVPPPSSETEREFQVSSIQFQKETEDPETEEARSKD
jgi:hypothetical protein